ncbi:universal stress protein [Microlunatus antarcticus]|uniref:Nucleotide-binding universal stress UspA family protein n=1 Tax=Microlunatus antarcticus TaxID=53388 RepID=A0A7W5JWW4_9ACTN|nr:universal stress protein [Microlunatus antarcticus]MBB3327242.1 nucleotide-binding universal stress UspA family protein [Microlunatus antarcticus]
MTWTRVVVGIDRSPGSSRALRWAADEALDHSAELYVVMAYSVPAPPVSIGYGQPPWRAEDEWRKDAEGALREALRTTLGDAPEVFIRSDVVEGSPAKALIDASQEADLLVVGTRGHGGFAGLLLGSVSQHVTAHAGCTVAVVR